MKNNIKKQSLYFIFLIILGIVLIIVARPVFQANDDAVMRSIISGRYGGTPDAHSIYMGYSLACFLCVLYKYVNSSISWYGILWGICILWSVFLITKDILFQEYDTRKKRRFAYSFVGILVLIYVNFFLIQQYTVVASIVGSTVLFNIIYRK